MYCKFNDDNRLILVEIYFNGIEFHQLVRALHLCLTACMLVYHCVRSIPYILFVVVLRVFSERLYLIFYVFNSQRLYCHNAYNRSDYKTHFRNFSFHPHVHIDVQYIRSIYLSAYDPTGQDDSGGTEFVHQCLSDCDHTHFSEI
jgi:hypothetical protein